jgi:hypothetical protein
MLIEFNCPICMELSPFEIKGTTPQKEVCVNCNKEVYVGICIFSHTVPDGIETIIDFINETMMSQKIIIRKRSTKDGY